MSRKNATILDDDVDNGYRVGNVIKHMNSRKTTWTITEYVVNNPTNDFVITNNQTGKTKFVSVVNLDRYWVFYKPTPVRTWTPENGWEEDKQND